MDYTKTTIGFDTSNGLIKGKKIRTHIKVCIL